MGARVIQGDVLDVLPTLEPGSIDVVCTSPPYWMLRSYLPKGHALKRRELGSEPTPEAYIENMVAVFRLVREAMADHATCWVNIGDTYAQSAMGRSRNGVGGIASDYKRATDKPGDGPTSVAAGNLCLIPQRLALALQADGWLVRSVIVWHKPAPMPQSVSGWAWRRCRVKVGGDNGGRSVKVAATGGNHRAVASFKDNRTDAGKALSSEGHILWSDCPGCEKCRPNQGYVLRRGSWRPTSSWEPILMLAKGPGYYADGESVRQPFAAGSQERAAYGFRPNDRDGENNYRNGYMRDADGGPVEFNPTGANLRDVLTIGPEPLKHSHYASYPTALPDLCLRAATSQRGYCPGCGSPWARVLETTYRDNPGHKWMYRGDVNRDPGSRTDLPPESKLPVVETLGWSPTCPCPPHEPRPGRVLDPFAGSSRTGIAALRLGLDFVGVELNPQYVALSRKLLREESPLFAGEG